MEVHTDNLAAQGSVRVVAGVGRSFRNGTVTLQFDVIATLEGFGLRHTLTYISVEFFFVLVWGVCSIR